MSRKEDILSSIEQIKVQLDLIKQQRKHIKRENEDLLSYKELDFMSIPDKELKLLSDVLSRLDKLDNEEGKLLKAYYALRKELSELPL